MMAMNLRRTVRLLRETPSLIGRGSASDVMHEDAARNIWMAKPRTSNHSRCHSSIDPADGGVSFNTNTTSTIPNSLVHDGTVRGDT